MAHKNGEMVWVRIPGVGAVEAVVIVGLGGVPACALSQIRVGHGGTLHLLDKSRLVDRSAAKGAAKPTPVSKPAPPPAKPPIGRVRLRKKK